MRLKIRIIPDTEIIAPRISEDRRRYFLEKGWIKDPHVDRAFPRDSKGRPYIKQRWIESIVTKADPGVGRRFMIEGGKILIPKKPILEKRPIFDGNGSIKHIETFECIDSTFELEFIVEVPDKYSKRFLIALARAGKEIGLGAGSKHGNGRFVVHFLEYEPSEPSQGRAPRKRAMRASKFSSQCQATIPR